MNIKLLTWNFRSASSKFIDAEKKRIFTGVAPDDYMIIRDHLQDTIRSFIEEEPEYY